MGFREKIQRPFLIKDFNYRKATDEEALAVAEALEQETGMSYIRDGKLDIRTENLAVLDSFSPDTPGWAGKMAMYVDGTHEAAWVFRLEDTIAEPVSTPDRY